MPHAALPLALTLLLARPAPARESPPSPPSPAASHGADAARPGHATVKHRFPGVARAKEMYDAPDRDGWQKPEDLVKALALAPGDRVADLGAGTGYFERHLAGAVGPTGAVFAIEVEPALVAALRERAEKEATAAVVVPVLASFDDPRLPPAAVDLVLIVDTYHHLDQRGRYFEKVKRSLRSGGRVAIVDFDKRPLPVGPGPEHKLAKAAVVAEMAAAGWRLDRDLEDLLPYQYVLVFLPGE